MTQTKDRPLVDPRVFELAETWLEDFEIDADYAAADSHEDATWDLAGCLQGELEAWIAEALKARRLKESAR